VVAFAIIAAIGRQRKKDLELETSPGKVSETLSQKQKHKGCGGRGRWWLKILVQSSEVVEIQRH
jgi:hypothetical protein